MTKTKELYRKYRPKAFNKVLGQERTIEILSQKFRTDSLPHTILLHGPFGTGKTTLARLITKYLKCGKYDYEELNTADYRGIDSIRAIRNRVNAAPVDGDVRVWLLDECHMTTRDAQNALLKLLEDPPDHVYFILATTEPDKLLSGIRQRCLKLKLNPIKDEQLEKIVSSVCDSEDIKIHKKVLEKLVEHAGGSGREALQILDQIRQFDSPKEQLRAIEKTSVNTQAILIARKLLDTRTKWSDITPILKELEGEDVEGLRYLVLNYGMRVLLNKDNARAFRMMDAFRDNFYDSKFAGFVASCYEVIQG